ncbi:hypothetical protein SLEP1_g49976 [Rubroshorea leprosula]|uniref:Protein transport protein Sec61 subunit beta n=1 Tax=Rubroshorea leprosula TaxID=152421 RepID=A0AAV5LYJ7_9ROSI|nr:hypothetical protein SLEP1_g49976 [Rubroshorea leprosula]
MAPARLYSSNGWYAPSQTHCRLDRARTMVDEAPGLKISPIVVLVMSLCFIGFVTALHVFGKLYRSKSGAEA